MSTESYDVDAYVVELRERIRELEAEQLVRDAALSNAWAMQRAAATRAEKAEARVAELEAFIGGMHKAAHAHVSEERPCPLDGFYWGRPFEAREREES